MPHRRHWSALLELAQDEDPERKLKEQFEDVDFEKEILARLEGMTQREVAEAVGLSRSYVGEIMRGETVPSLEHWEAFEVLDECRKRSGSTETTSS